MDAPAGQDAPGPPEPPEPPEPPCPPGGAPSLEKAPLIDGSFSMDRPKPLDNKPRTASLIVADRSRGDEDGLLWPGKVLDGLLYVSIYVILTYTHVDTHAHMYTQSDKLTQTYTHTHSHTHTHTHSHTHTHTDP